MGSNRWASCSGASGQRRLGQFANAFLKVSLHDGRSTRAGSREGKQVGLISEWLSTNIFALCALADRTKAFRRRQYLHGIRNDMLVMLANGNKFKEIQMKNEI